MADPTPDSNGNNEFAEQDARKRIETAYHEAGHAVAGYCLHRTIRSVTIAATEGTGNPGEKGRTLGSVDFIDWWQEPAVTSTVLTRAIAEREARILMAGVVANAIRDHLPYRPANHQKFWGRRYGADGDRAVIMECYYPSFGETDDERWRTFQTLRGKTHRLLRDNWQAVEALALQSVSKLRTPAACTVDAP